VSTQLSYYYTVKTKIQLAFKTERETKRDREKERNDQRKIEIKKN
jgi:hypothetical protein